MINEYILSIKKLMEDSIIDKSVVINIPKLLDLLLQYSRNNLVSIENRMKTSLSLFYLFNPYDVSPDGEEFKDYFDDFYLIFYLCENILYKDNIFNKYLSDMSIDKKYIKNSYNYFKNRVSKDLRSEIIELSMINYTKKLDINKDKIVNSLLSMFFNSKNKSTEMKKAIIKDPAIINFYENLKSEEKKSIIDEIEKENKFLMKLYGIKIK